MEEAQIKRILPNSTEAEQSVIGSMIMDADAIRTAAGIISGDDFYNKKYGIVFDAMVELQGAGQPVDIITLQNKLKEKDAPPEVSSMEYVKDFIDTVPTSANVKYYANIVYEKAVLRRLIRTNEEIANMCYSEKEELNEILSTTEKNIYSIVQKRNTSDFVPIRQVVINTLDMIEQAAKTQGNVTGISTGFSDLDFYTAGFHPSELILIAARPAMGKTAFALNIALHAATRLKKSVALFSLEMSKEQLMLRLLAMESNVNSQNLRTGNLSDKDWSKIMEGADPLGNSRMFIDDTGSISIAELSSKCRKIKMEKGLDLIVIDYLQLMSGSGKTDSRQQEVSEISRSLKALARELEVPVVALSQLSRKVEERPDHKPMLSDLRESGSIEQDADLVMFIYRDDYYNKDTNKPNIAEIIIAKQRSGSVGNIELAWIPEYTQFKNLAK
ncbi:MAG: replicative DNA helicase [Lachnospiraceae bacterium]|nr:replicative DNA helicase [Lachnospiraceae bacterium]